MYRCYYCPTETTFADVVHHTITCHPHCELKARKHQLDASSGKYVFITNNDKVHSPRSSQSAKGPTLLPPPTPTVSAIQPIPNLLEKQLSYWQDGTSPTDLEESRGSRNLKDSYLDRDLLADVAFLLNRLESKASRLIGNNTTNLAESWMSVGCKFNGGKLFKYRST
jgi:hypothetical protein